MLAVAAAVGSLALASQALAVGPTLSLSITADNSFNAYLANSPTDLGTLITFDGPITHEDYGKDSGGNTLAQGGTVDAAGNPWQGDAWHAVRSVTLPLTGNGIQFLHIIATDQTTGGAGIIATATITDNLGTHTLSTNYEIINGIPTSTWLSANPTDKTAGNSFGFGLNTTTWHLPTDEGTNGVGPWNGPIGSGIAANAKWIWETPYTFEGSSTAARYFATAITYSSVPEATTMLFGLAAVMPLLSQRRRQRAAATPVA